MPPKKVTPDDIKKTILEFVSELKECIFPTDDQTDLIKVEYYFKNMPATNALQHVVSHILPYKEQILSKNEDYFDKEKESIFKGLEKGKVQHFTALLKKSEKDGGMSQSNKDAIWAYFKVLITLAENLKKKD